MANPKKEIDYWAPFPFELELPELNLDGQVLLQELSNSLVKREVEWRYTGEYSAVIRCTSKKLRKHIVKNARERNIKIG
jgi:hypothetical protein